MDAFINAIIFSDNINNRLKIIENNSVDKIFLLDLFYAYLQKNKDRNMFDEKLINNCYKLIDYLNQSNIDQLNKINEMKIILNNDENYNLGFLRSQILLRDYGSSYYSFNRIRINKIPDSVISKLKEVYYLSIVYDLNFLNIFKYDEETFNKVNDMYLLNKNFYRSLNYFIIKCGPFFKNQNYMNRIRFIIEKDLNLILNKMYDVDDEFFDIVNVTNHLIKKIDKNDRKNI